MEATFRYTFDRRSKWLTVFWIMLFLSLFAAFLLLGRDNYLKAWIFSIFVAVALLYVLSIPRYVRVSRTTLEIQCLVELTRIELRDITSVSVVDPCERMNLVPLLGSYGFFGYFGWYLDFRQWEIVKVYASQWKNFMLIEDIYEQRYLISCSQPEEFLNFLGQHIGERG